MASFTDNIPQFNPYVQQLPVEAMVSVGMEKQKRYDEGLQKIQGQIQQVAGLDVLRPIDKDYLQSKLNELGGNLQTFAASDFSNFQLTNSVGGMVNQISKDPFVLAAVKSTAIDRKNAEFIESEKKAGKLDPGNLYVYNLQRNKYINSGLKDEQGNPLVFSGQYEPYRDVYKKLSDVAKDVGIDESIIPNLFDSNGQVSKVMVETLIKGKDANKIYDAFVNTLDSGDYRQLEINGIYKYRDRSPQDIVTILETSNKQYAQTTLDKQADLLTEVADLKSKLPKAKGEELIQINKKISSLETLIQKSNTSIKDDQDNFLKVRDRALAGDEDQLNAIKGKIYTNNFLASLSKDFSSKISHVKYSENPLWKAIMDEKQFALDSWYKRESVKAAKRANELKEKELMPILQATGAVDGSQVNIAENVNQDYMNTVGQRDQKLINLARWDMKRLGWTEGKMKEWVSAQAKNKGISEAEVLANWGTTTLTQIKSGQTKPTSEIASEVNSINGLNIFVSGLQKLMKSADEKAKLEGGESVKNVPDILKETKPVTVNVGSNGKNITLSAQDQLDLARFVSKREIFSTGVEDKEREMATTRLKNKFGTYTPYLQAWAESEFARTPGTIRQAFGAKPTPFQEVINKYSGSAYEAFKTSQEKVYRETFSALYPKNETFALTDKLRPIVQANMSAMFIDRPEFAEMKKKLDYSNSQIVVTTAPSITGLGATTQLSMKVVGKDGEATEAIPISLDQYQSLFNKQPSQPNPSVILTEAIVNGSPDKSSNSNGIGSIPTSFFGRDDFKYISPEYNILGGDFIKDSDGRDIYYPKLYYVPKGANDPVPLDIGVGMSLPQALAFPTMMTDAKLKQIINKK
jgi:hypothetical protein